MEHSAIKFDAILNDNTSISDCGIVYMRSYFPNLITTVTTSIEMNTYHLEYAKATIISKEDNYGKSLFCIK